MNTRRTATLVSHGFCALLIGFCAGAFVCAKNVKSERVALEWIFEEANTEEEYAKSDDEHLFHEREISCLTEVVIREAGGELIGNRRLVAMVYIARRDDADPQWPKTLCEIAHQKDQVSQITKQKVFEAKEWLKNHEIAEDIYWGAWRTQFLPQGWECVRYYKMSDHSLARLKPKHKKQLGIGKGHGLAYFHKLAPVETRGVHTFYEDPKRCITPLPTVARNYKSPR